MQTTEPNRVRDMLGAGMLIVLGSAAAATAWNYHVGTMTRMGPGFMPAALGIILVLVGFVLLATSALFRSPARHVTRVLPSIDRSSTTGPEWRGWACICLGVILFAVLAENAGLMAGTFACVFVCALGDRENTLRQAGLLALGMTLAAVVVFWWGLGVPIPLWKWDFG